MKLLFVADHLKFGGAERHLVALATGLARRGHEVAVAYMKAHNGQAQDGQAHADLAADLARGGVTRLVCCHSRGGIDRAAIGALAALMRTGRPQVVVATSQYSLMCASLARMLAGAPARRESSLAFICHSMECVRRSRADRLRFLVYRQFYRAPAAVVFVSELQRVFFAGLSIRPRRSEVVHNGIDLGYFSAAAVAEPAAALRREHGFTSDELVIGLCAVFREEKRQVDLLEAVARLRAQGIGARAVLVGDGLMRPQIEACRDRLGLQDAVLLAGFQQDVRPWIGMCDVMALTSHAETFPIATLEYMALGKALVASAVGGMGEQVTDGANGLLYPAGDIGALTAALARFADQDLCRRLGQGALDTVRARFDVQRMIGRYEHIFADLVKPARVERAVRHAD